MQLVKPRGEDTFRTTGTAAYPDRMNEAIAQAIWNHAAPRPPQPSTFGRAERKDVEDGGAAEVEKRVEEVIQRAAEEAARGELQEKEETAGGVRRGGWGPPIEAYYKGKFRAIHDGGGLASPGRWKVGKRRPMKAQSGTELSAVCRKEFLRWVLKKEGEPGGVKELFFRLAAGLCEE